MRPWWAELGHELPETYVSIGFSSKGARSKVIGQCHYTSKDGRPQIFIHPMLSDGVCVLATLIHELVHATLGPGFGHKSEFSRLAKSLGLVKPWTETTAGPELAETLTLMIRRGLGPYPHSRLGGSSSGPKKQTTRMIKVVCPADHGEKPYTARTTRKWLDDLGAPYCPCGEQMEEAS